MFNLFYHHYPLPVICPSMNVIPTALQQNPCSLRLYWGSPFSVFGK